jgi:hypothetical protein
MYRELAIRDDSPATSSVTANLSPAPRTASPIPETFSASSPATRSKASPTRQRRPERNALEGRDVGHFHPPGDQNHRPPASPHPLAQGVRCWHNCRSRHTVAERARARRNHRPNAAPQRIRRCDHRPLRSLKPVDAQGYQTPLRLLDPECSTSHDAAHSNLPGIHRFSNLLCLTGPKEVPLILN